MRFFAFVFLLACGGSSNGPGPATPTTQDVTGTWLLDMNLPESRKIQVVYDLRGDSSADIYVRWDMLDNEKDFCLRITGRWVFANGKLTFEVTLPERVPIGKSVDVDFPRKDVMRMIDAKGGTALLDRGSMPNVSDCRTGPLK